jgi:hypothetical protein
MVLVVTVATSALAVTLCHTSCAVDAPWSLTGNLGHSCHDESPGRGSRFMPVHFCGHEDVVTRATGTALASGSHETPGAVVADKPVRTASPPVVAPSSEWDSGIPPTGRAHSNTPLRI